MSNFLTLLSNQPQVVLFRNQAFYFTRSGSIDLDTGSLRTIGRNDHYWSSTTVSNINSSYYFRFDNVNAQPSNYIARWYGFLLRCIAS